MELAPAWPKGYYRAGVAYYRLGQLVEALDMFETAAGMLPFDECVQGACMDMRVRLKLLPVGAIPEIGKAYLRPRTAVSRDVLGAGWLYAWGGAGVGALGLGDTDNQVYPKCIDAFRGRMVRVTLGLLVFSCLERFPPISSPPLPARLRILLAATCTL